MKLSFSRPRGTAIGLHLGPRFATLVQVSGPAERAGLTAMAQGVLPARGELTDEEYDVQVSATLKLLVSDHGFRGRQVVSCVPAGDLHLQSVRLPQLPADEMEKVVRWEAQERLPFPAANAELRYLLAGQIRQDASVKQEVVLMACQQAVLQRHLRVLEQAGLVPVAIDVEPCAVLRAFRHGQSDSNERVAYLHLGDSLTTVFIADGDAIRFLKYVGSGGREMDQAVAKHLELDLPEAMRLRASVTNSPALDSQSDVHRSVIEAIRPQLEALASELELCFRYFMVTFRGQSAAKLIVTGSEASPWLSEYLGHSLSYPVEVGNPFATLAEPPQMPSAVERPGRWAAAFGLSLRSIGL
jgi:type IV pilus assembly protein PilM